MSPLEAQGTAEAQFRAAFERLKLDKPAVLSKGTLVSQNNVAKEAGRDPTALKKSRYPGLIAEIQCWVEAHAGDVKPSPTARIEAARRRNRTLSDAKTAMQVQFDEMASELLAARTKILELHQAVERLKAELGLDNIVPMRPARG